MTALAAAGGVLVVPQPSFGQEVSDRTLSDVKVEKFGGCSVLTVNFNIRVQMLSYFPQNGRELHVRVRPLDVATSNQGQESLRTPASVPELRSIHYEGDNPSGPVLSLFFTEDMRYEIEAGAQPQALVIRLAKPAPGPICAGSPDRGSPPSPWAHSAPPPPLPPGVAVPAGLYDEEIYQAARDNTYVAKSMTVSYSRPITAKL